MQQCLTARDIEVTCRSCGSSFTLHPAWNAAEGARDCLVCPVCWRAGPGLEEALESGAAECGVDDGHRFLACVRPDGPELEGAPRELRELARMLWRLAATPGTATTCREPQGRSTRRTTDTHR